MFRKYFTSRLLSLAIIASFSTASFGSNDPILEVYKMTNCEGLLGRVQFASIYFWNEYEGFQARFLHRPIGSPAVTQALVSRYMGLRLGLISEAVDLSAVSEMESSILKHLNEFYSSEDFEVRRVHFPNYLSSALRLTASFGDAWEAIQEDEANLKSGRATVLDVHMNRQLANIGDFVVIDSKTKLVIAIVDSKTGDSRRFQTFRKR